MIRNVSRLSPMVASLAIVLAIWTVVTTAGSVNTVLFPSPQAVWSAAVELYRDGDLLSDLTVSLRRAGIGFLIGAVSGVAVGLLTARLRVVGRALHPILNILRPIPAIALVPVAIVWFGIGE